MVAPLSPWPALVRPILIAALALLAAMIAIDALAAETLIDPTRNPYLNRGDDTPAAAPVAAPAPSRLQMIVRGPGERRTAVIDDTLVAVGDTVTVRGASARVERITDTAVVLARGDAKETLQLLPGAERAVRCVRTEARPGGC